MKTQSVMLNDVLTSILNDDTLSQDDKENDAILAIIFDRSQAYDLTRDRNDIEFQEIRKRSVLYALQYDAFEEFEEIPENIKIDVGNLKSRYFEC